MSQSTKGDGTKIAQAAKDLNVTSVTIRRYISEFDIETTADENGVKVLPARSMTELHEIRRLKEEEGLTNPKVMELLEKQRTQDTPAKPKSKARATAKSTPVAQEEELEEPRQPVAKRASRATAKTKVEEPIEAVETTPEADLVEGEPDREGESDSDAPARSKHSLTCQTCGKVFEHMNPRLRDCLDCYRTKRKERRRGGADRHKHVIQHPIAQQVTTKTVQQSQLQSLPQVQQPALSVVPTQRTVTVRNYRKAIEETRHITSNLKRRLERPDLMEGERRWLEQIYAYQLILHQGWRHLSEYKSANQQQAKAERNENPIA